MMIMTGQVVGGRIEVEADLEEGTRVVVLSEWDSGTALTPDEKQELATALESIGSGDYEDGHELLVKLKDQNGPKG
jgi:heme-degrading monooxygenase HmoA